MERRESNGATRAVEQSDYVTVQEVTGQADRGAVAVAFELEKAWALV
jgi:hypothetical protein